MSKSYGTSGPTASGSSLKTALGIRATAAIRAGLRIAKIWQITAPAATDFQFQAGIGRFTAQGTTASSPPTPVAKDGGDVPCVNTIEWTDSVEPTYTAASVLQEGGNQRSTIVFQQQDGKEYWSLATASNGIGIYLLATTPVSVSTWQATVDFIE